MVDLWLTCRGTGFAAGPLPFPGAAADQPACVMASFALCDSAVRLLTAKPETDS